MCNQFAFYHQFWIVLIFHRKQCCEPKEAEMVDSLDELKSYDKRSIQKLNEVTESERSEINRALAGDEQLRRDQQLLHEQLLEQNRELREAHVKSLDEMEELKRFQGSTFDTFSRRTYTTRQCCYSEQLLPVHISCRMCNQFTFHHQFGIDTWRSKLEQQTDSNLSDCGSHGQKP